MDWANIFLFGFISSIIGAAILLLAQYYFFVRYFNTDELNQKESTKNCVLPDVSMLLTLNKCLRKYVYIEMENNLTFFYLQSLLFDIHSPSPESKDCTMAINLILQFLFFELRNTSKVREWFYKKLSAELDQISKTTTGKLFEKLTVG